MRGPGVSARKVTATGADAAKEAAANNRLAMHESGPNGDIRFFIVSFGGSRELLPVAFPGGAAHGKGTANAGRIRHCSIRLSPAAVTVRSSLIAFYRS